MSSTSCPSTFISGHGDPAERTPRERMQGLVANLKREQKLELTDKFKFVSRAHEYIDCNGFEHLLLKKLASKAISGSSDALAADGVFVAAAAPLDHRSNNSNKWRKLERGWVFG